MILLQILWHHSGDVSLCLFQPYVPRSVGQLSAFSLVQTLPASEPSAQNHKTKARMLEIKNVLCVKVQLFCFHKNFPPV